MMPDVQEILSAAMSSHRLFEFVGVVGAMVYIGGFYLVQSGRVCGNSVVYPISKVVAAVLVLASLATAFNLAAFLIQVSYAAIGIWGVARRYRNVPVNGARPCPDGLVPRGASASAGRGGTSGVCVFC